MSYHMHFYLFFAYFLAVITVCVLAYHYSDNLSDYILGGRSLSAPVAALGVGASDMSSWLLMALPGAAYLYGMTQIWMPIGLAIGAYLNWVLVAKRLRVYTEMANDSLTIPSFFDARVEDPRSLIRIITAIVILFFFTVYAAAGFKGGALVFSNVFHLSSHAALLGSALFIVLYTTIGGFLAISWVDFFQGCLLFVAIIAIPILIYYHIHPIQQHAWLASLSHHWIPVGNHQSSAIMIMSLLAWGLGYFGQPHILVRFMAIKKPGAIPASQRIHVSWMIMALLGTFAIGLLGHYSLPTTLKNPESVLIALANTHLPRWLAGLLFAIMLSAIMSAISAQLLAAASAVTADLYNRLRRKELCGKHLLSVGRVTVLALGLIALFIADNPSNNILKLVSYAWAGLGASFGPCILLSLYWKKLSAKGAMAGIVIAAFTVVVWKMLGIHYGGLFKLYELVPAFCMNFLVSICVSLWFPDKGNDKRDLFDRVQQQLTESD